MTADDRFDFLIKETLKGARAIPCSKKEYREGLRWLIEEIQMEINAAEESEELDGP